MICDFDVYQGSVNGIRAKSELGLSGDVVMKLASTLPEVFLLPCISNFSEGAGCRLSQNTLWPLLIGYRRSGSDVEAAQ
ncbi:hypothetical protein NQZ68_035390 [Dissostichus eleginoides]|nr:hypothetical protein NQZ68_035390 [Dissostichus eleginoides]